MRRQTINRHTGSTISELNHVRQSIADILTTPIGSRIMRRDYGSLIFSLIDQPFTDTLRLQLAAASLGAIMRWEPRVRVLRALVTEANYSGTAALELELELKSSGSLHNISVPLTMGAL